MYPRRFTQGVIIAPYLLLITALLVGLTYSVGAAPATGAATDSLTFIEAQYDGIGLGAACSVAVSPDGSHVYVAGADDDAVAVFSRNGASGALTLVEVQRDDAGGVDGLDSPQSVALSPDGGHVYVASSHDDAVVVFSRNGTSGVLTFVEVQKDGGGVDGLDGAKSVTVSPDGGHVYVAGTYDNAVAVFSRNGTSGALTFVEVQQDDAGGVDGLNGAYSVAVSPDGSHVYAASLNDDAVAVFGRNETSGALTFVERKKDGEGGVDGLDGANCVAVSPDGSHVYVASFDNAVAAFGRNETSGALTFVERQKDGEGGVDGLDSAVSVAVSPDGSHVYVAGYSDDAVAVFSRNGSSGALTFVERQKDGEGGVDGLDWAYSVAVSPDGSHVYVAGLVDDAVAVFGRNETSGALTFVEVQQDDVGGVDGLDGANSVAVSPDGGHVYVAGLVDDAVAVFSRDETSGALTFVEMQKDGVGGVDGLSNTKSVAVSPDGGHVYAAGYDDDGVAVFSRNGTSGALTFVEAQQDSVGGVDGLNGAYSVAVSPDGGHVYVAGYLDDAVAVFSRDGTSGALTFVEVQRDNVGGVDGLDHAIAVAVSPDGSHVYVAGTYDNAVAVFGRNDTSGALTFVESHWGWYMNGARSFAFSPDGSHVYVASQYREAVVAFSRNGSSGVLTFVEEYEDGVGGMDGLEGASSVAVSPDGDHVYVASLDDDGVAVFSRNGSDGKLTFVEAQRDGVGGAHGLDGARSVAVSPDGSHVYVAGYNDDAVAVFGVSPGVSVYLPLVVKD